MSDETSVNRELQALQADHARMLRELGEFGRRLMHLEAKLSPTRSLVVPPPAETEAIAPIEVELVEAVAVADEPLVPVASAQTFARETPRSTAATFDWEAFIGGRGLTWLGSFVLLMALGFGVHWAWTTFESPAWVQVLGLHTLGMGLLGAAYVFHCRRMAIVCQAVSGLGLFTLYAVALATLHLYGFWSETTAFLEFLAITVLAIGVALRLSSWPVIVIGALGGYLAPVLTSSDSGSHVMLFLYLASLNVALMACAVWRGWSWLKPLALAATTLMFLAWLVGGTPVTHRWSTQWLLTLHASIFLLATTLPPWLWRRSSTWSDHLCLPSNALGFLGGTWLLFHEQQTQQLALVCWGLTLLHLVLFGVTYVRVSNVDRMPRLQLALAAVFLTLAIPLQLDNAAFWGMTWAVEGFVFTLVGLWFVDRQMCITAGLLFVLSAVRLIGWDYDWFNMVPDDGSIASSFLRIATGGLLMMGSGALYWLLPQGKQLEFLPGMAGRSLGGSCLVAGNLLLLVSTTCQWQGLALHSLWTLNAAVVWALGFYRGLPSLRWYGFALGTLLGMRVFFDSISWVEPYPLLLNARFGSLGMMAALYLAAGLAYRSLEQQDDATGDGELPGTQLEESKLDMLLAVLGHFILVVALTLELRGWFASEVGRQSLSFSNAWMAQMASYSILWAAYAAGLVALGLAMRYAIYRYLGLLAFVFIVGKVFLVDLRELELFPRVMALPCWASADWCVILINARRNTRGRTFGVMQKTVAECKTRQRWLGPVADDGYSECSWPVAMH